MENSKVKEELLLSCITEELIDLNFFYSDNFDTLLSNVCFYLDNNQRTNLGRLAPYWLRRYKHLEQGGWYSPIYDPIEGVESDWAIVKPNQPRLTGKGDPIKYESPASTPSRCLVLKVGIETINLIAENHPALNLTGVENNQEFWEFVADHNEMPIILTEGTKKVASVLSQGYACIGASGVNNYLEEGKLKPILKHFAVKGRTFYIAFDRDRKFKTKMNVNKAIETLGKFLAKAKCTVKILEWSPDEGKGIDDYIYNDGLVGCLLRQAVPYNHYIEENNKKPIVLRSDQIADLLLSDNYKIRRNLLTDEIEVKGVPFSLNRPLKPFFYETTGFIASNESWAENIEHIANKYAYDPVVEYLNKVHREYQGKYESLDNLSEYFFKTNKPIYNVYAKLFLIGAVARAFDHGCQVDTILVLKGDQGKNKTRFFLEMAGEPFFDNSIINISSKDVYLVMGSAWIAELAELESITTKKLAGEIKQWLSRRVDTYRKPYDRHAQRYPRRTAFCGTVNKNTFLLDETGNRRFWVIPINNETPINIKDVREKRDLIWASAVELYKQGAIWYLTDEQVEIQTAENKAHEAIHVWLEQIQNYCHYKNMVSVNDIFEQVLEIPSGQRKRHQREEIVHILQEFGFTEQTRVNTCDGRRWFYKRPDGSQYEIPKGENVVLVPSVSPEDQKPKMKLTSNDELLGRVKKALEYLEWTEKQYQLALIKETGRCLIENLEPDQLFNFVQYLEKKVKGKK